MSTTITALDQGVAEDRKVRRSIVNQELMMLYGHDVTGYLPPLPKNERPKSSVGNVWTISNPALRQLSNGTRRGPRVTIFPGKQPQKKPPAIPEEMKRPHTSYQNHITSILNTKIDGFRPHTSQGKIESISYKVFNAVEKPVGLITPKPLPHRDTYTEAQLAAIERLLSGMDSRLRRPRLQSALAKRRKKSKKDTCKVDIDLKYKVDEYISRVLGGDIDNVPDDMPTQVKLFVASNRLDMCEERSVLRTQAYPELRAYCQRMGLEFQVVDICGPPEDSTDLQFWVDQLNNCKSQSVGPYFVGLLGDYLGPPVPPPVIAADDFDTLCKVASSNHLENHQLIRDSYQLNENIIPAIYTFKKGVLSEEALTQLPLLISDTAALACQLGQIHPDKANTFMTKSAMQLLFQQGVFWDKANPKSKCCVFHRHFQSIEEDISGKRTPQYTDAMVLDGQIKFDVEKDTERKTLLTTLSETLHESDMKIYDVQWQGEGLQRNIPEHQEYLDQLVADFVQIVKSQIDLNKQAWDIKHHRYEMYRATRLHAKLCENHHQLFGGRQDLLDVIRGHITNEEKCSLPLFIVGQRGMGKSTLLSTIVKLFPHWGEKDNAAAVIRFVGLTPDCCRLRDVLVALAKHICYIYNIEDPQPRVCQTPDAMVRYFLKMMDIISKHFGEERPLLIALDGIEKLDETDRSQSLFWLPETLPNNIHFVLTMSCENPEMVNQVKQKFPAKAENFVEVGHFKKEDLTLITQRILDTNKRRLMPSQLEALSLVCKPESHPLYVHHMLCEALRWESSHIVDRVYSLPTNLEDSILKLLYGLEDQFGTTLTKQTILYLSYFDAGLSEVELRDLLLQTGDVVNDLLKYTHYRANKDNVAAVLSLILAKMLERLKHFLQCNSFFNKQLYRWTHPEYRTICIDQYCKIKSEEQMLSSHPAILGMFLEHEGVSTKIRTEATSWQLLATEVSPQYLLPSNQHKLHLLPTLIAKASPNDYMNKLKEMCLCNFQFLVTKITGLGVEAAQKDLDTLVEQRDLETDLINNFFRVAHKSLSVHPQNLASQLLGCVPYLDPDLYPNVSHMMEKVVDWLMESNSPILVPQLPCFQSATDPCKSRLTGVIQVLAVDETGSLLVVKSKDGMIEIWDSHHLERVFFLGIKYDKMTPNIFCSVSRVLGINPQLNYKVWEIKSGLVTHCVDLVEVFGDQVSTLICMCHTKEFEFVAFHVSDEEFNQIVAVVDTKKKSIVYKLTYFDVKDEFFRDSAAFVNGGKRLLFANARSELVGEEKSEDIVNLSYHNMDNLDHIFTVQCGNKKFKKLMEKDGRIAILSWQDCSFDVYDLHTGDHLKTLNYPDQELFCQACTITEDGYLVALATSGSHYALWFWNIEESVSSELISGSVDEKDKDVPNDFLIIEDLHLAVLGTPETAQLMVYDLPTSECIFRQQVHGQGLDNIFKARDPYMVYTGSNAEKLVKLWDLYAVIETQKQDRCYNTVSFDDDDDSLDISDLLLPDREVETPQFTQDGGLFHQKPLDTLESVSSCVSLMSVGSTEGILKRSGSSSGSKPRRPKSVRFSENLTVDHPLKGLESITATTSAEEQHSMLRTEDERSVKSDSIQAEPDSPSPELRVLFSSRDERTVREQTEAMTDVSCVDFSQSQAHFVSGRTSDHPVIWDTVTGCPTMHCQPHSTCDLSVQWVSFACQDTLIVGLTDTGEAMQRKGWPKILEYQVWEASTGCPVLHPNSSLVLTSPTAAVSHDRERILLIQVDFCDPGGNDRAELIFKLVNIREHQCLREYSVFHPAVPSQLQLSDDNMYCVSLSPKHNDPKTKIMATLFLESKPDQDPALKVYKFPSGKKNKRNGPTSHVIWHNGLGLVAGCHGDIQMWDLASGEYEENIYQDPMVKDKADPSLENHNGKMINHMVVSSDTRYMLAGSKDCTSSLWDLENEVLLHSYGGHTDEVSQVALSEDSQLLLTAGNDYVLNVWQFGNTDKPLCRLYIHVSPTVLKITNDKRTVVAVGAPTQEAPKLLVLKLINL